MLNLYLQNMSKRINKEFQGFLQDFDMRVVQHEHGNIGISTEGGDHQGKKLYMIAPSCGAKKNRFL